jgi:hypothetical protein
MGVPFSQRPERDVAINPDFSGNVLPVGYLIARARQANDDLVAAHFDANVAHFASSIAPNGQKISEVGSCVGCFLSAPRMPKD